MYSICGIGMGVGLFLSLAIRGMTDPPSDKDAFWMLFFFWGLSGLLFSFARRLPYQVEVDSNLVTKRYMKAGNIVEQSMYIKDISSFEAGWFSGLVLVGKDGTELSIPTEMSMELDSLDTNMKAIFESLDVVPQKKAQTFLRIFLSKKTGIKDFIFNNIEENYSQKM